MASERALHGEKDIFAIQDEIAGAIVERVRPTVMAARGGSNPLGQRPPATTNMEAYDLYLQGLFALRDGDVGNDEDGVRLLEEAMKLDPGFNRAKARLDAIYLAKEGEKK